MPWSNQPGGPWSSGPRGPWGSGPQQQGPRPADLEEFLRRSQDKLRGFLPGNFGGRGIMLIVVAALVLWGFSGFFRVEPDELGVVLRFGKFVREVGPGLNYHLPYPIETALTPPALRVIKTDVGMRQSGAGERDVPEESLMLTGDENIVDVHFTVLWKVKPSGVGDYLFNIQNPEGTVKAVAESAMREVIGQSNIQPILTGARQNIETAVQALLQKTLDGYGAGIQIQQVQLQKVDPPAAVIDSFRDVQRANTDADRMRNEAESFHNDIVPRARGDAARLVAEADGARQANVAETTGQAQRFLSVLKAYQAAKDVTLTRLYIETMQEILSHTPSVVVDQGLQGVVPYLPLNDLGHGSPKAAAAAPASSTGAIK